jgi:type IV pilus assembly protein PilY1
VHQGVPRRLYSNLENSTTLISEDDSRITTALLDIDDWDDKDTARKDLIQWMRGYDVLDTDGDDVTNEARAQMADPLHSEPLFYSYGDSSASVYIGTNEGYLLSIDASSGDENWAFMPKDLIKNVPVYYENPSVFNNRTYGMDGAINAWTEDGKKYLIVGQRRGGDSYYVLDITSRNSPVFKYEISAEANSAFANLGQTWSKPTITTIDINGDESKVLIFGGGYDSNQDTAEVREKDSIGNSIYIVKASTGALLAEISGKSGATYTLSGMDYSIPSRVAVIDKDFDGLVDHIYAADMGGQIMRVDVYNGQVSNKLFVGKVLYSSSVDDSQVKNRRFYNAPDVAEIVHDNEHYYAVTVGSGYRAHPLNEEIQDSVLMLKDKGVFAKSDGLYTFPTISSLAQITPESPTIDDTSSYDGYEFNLEVGEKVLTGVSIINSRIVFSTYDPSSAGLVENSCSAAQGGGRLYVINLLDGQALADINNDGEVDYNDTYATLDKSGIPAEPRLIITDPSAPTICIGTECADTVESADDEGDIFKTLAGQISGAQSNLNKVFSNSWSSEVEPAKKD